MLGEQHRAWRAAAAGSVALFGDLQIGFSHRDVWSQRALFRPDYLMGAPPSRTNPAGQAWGYPVLDPDRYRNPDGGAGPVLHLVLGRVARMLDDFDGLRVDHPHGLICPWVYDAADADPAAAVGRGARLFESPDLPDHPRLAALAIPTRAQLSADPGIARYADDWVRELSEAQVDRYGLLFDGMMAQVRAAGRSVTDVICEVLSTWPYPLRRVMQRHGLGRFRVTQKADLTRADDVYRAENAAPNDWIMVGNHDTPPIWALARQWHGTADRSRLGRASGAAADARTGAAPAAGAMAGGRSPAPVPGPVRRAVRQSRPARVGVLRRPVRGPAGLQPPRRGQRRQLVVAPAGGFRNPLPDPLRRPPRSTCRWRWRWPARPAPRGPAASSVGRQLLRAVAIQEAAERPASCRF